MLESEIRYPGSRGDMQEKSSRSAAPMGFRTLDFGVGRFLHCVDGFWIVDFRFGRFLPSLVLIDRSFFF